MSQNIKEYEFEELKLLTSDHFKTNFTTTASQEIAYVNYVMGTLLSEIVYRNYSIEGKYIDEVINLTVRAHELVNANRRINSLHTSMYDFINRINDFIKEIIADPLIKSKLILLGITNDPNA